ncbi:DUF2726 domain-containing protein [Candidatus Albibeggiatoa sp. nov. NOAA]|uniref:DUF2726 domain-containing protein n=1 Tax=Candidatus Albibeggiatoa sp. nov. NOAA TaxID=3162724 RepID=UPI003305589D|nr:DUF2726 domain-containing protein [Thiotrichaceae bacterium]
MLWIVLSIIIFIVVAIFLIFNTSLKSRFIQFFSYQNRFKSELPDVELYGGQQKSTIIATEYPHSQPLQVKSIDIDYQINSDWPTSDKFPLFLALQAVLPRYYMVFHELNLSRFVTTDDALAFNRLQQYEVDFAIFDLKQKQWIGCIIFKSKNMELNEKIRFKFIQSILKNIDLPLLSVPKLKNYKLSTLQSLIKREFNL